MKIDSNKYNNIVVNMVQDCTKEIIELFKEHNIVKILFYQHEGIDVPNARFDALEPDTDESRFMEVGEVTINGTDVLVIGSDTRYNGYLDGYYGEYFDVAQSIPQIYKAIVDIINNNDLKPNELN